MGMTPEEKQKRLKSLDRTGIQVSITSLFNNDKVIKNDIISSHVVTKSKNNWD
jgi:hypothetical protein